MEGYGIFVSVSVVLCPETWVSILGSVLALKYSKFPEKSVKYAFYHAVIRILLSSIVQNDGVSLIKMCIGYFSGNKWFYEFG